MAPLHEKGKGKAFEIPQGSNTDSLNVLYNHHDKMFRSGGQAGVFPISFHAGK